MHAYYCHHFVLPLPPEHRFPMAKYRLLFERVQASADALGIQLHEPPPAELDDLLRVHCPEYVARMLAGRAEEREMRRIGFPWSPQMVERSRRSAGGTIQALTRAIATGGVAANLAGGTHHAAFDRGGGYCVFNDAVIAARHVRHHGLARKVLLIDLDVHHGDGSAALCAADPGVFTFSMHAEKNYPALKPPSDYDVPLASGTGDEDYLQALDWHMPLVLSLAGADAAVYLAGADPFAGDRLGYLKLSKPGLAERDRRVLAALADAGIPVAVVMAGGYAEDVRDIVDIHFETLRQAAFSDRSSVPSPGVLCAPAEGAN